ncbi:MAG: amidohydrolase family protein [Mycoplasma sp.]
MITLLKNCLLSSNKVVDILFGEKIIDIKPNIELSDDWNIIDLNNQLVMPGMVDIHVHMRGMKQSYKEDYVSGSQACIENGITTICDMPNSVPPTINVENLLLKVEERKKSTINTNLYLGLNSSSTYEEVQEMLKTCIGIKIFLDESTGKMNFNLKEIDQRIFELDTLYLFHAEDDSILEIANIIKNKDARIHVCHVSSEREYINYLELKKSYKNITFEVTPHHLLLNTNNFSNEKLNKVKPSLKGEKDQQFILDLLINKKVMCIATDHAPHTLEEKAMGMYGFGGVDTSLKILFKIFKENDIELSYLEEIYSLNPARIIKQNNIGKIDIGYNADLIVINQNNQHIINDINIISKCNWTPFNNYAVEASVDMTFINGKLIFKRKGN